MRSTLNAPAADSTSEYTQHHPDSQRRKLVQATAACGGLALAAASYPFVVSFLPSERARALGAPLEVDVSPLAPGVLATLLVPPHSFSSARDHLVIGRDAAGDVR